jgi:PIN domain nuclease of toxin-antitoxin system
MKRNLVIVFVLVLAAAAGYYWFSGENTPFSKDNSLYKAVPVSAPLFFEFSSMVSIPSGNPVIKELLDADIAKSWFDILQKADSLIHITEELPGNLRNNPFILTFGTAGRSELVPLFITKAESQNRQSDYELLIQKLYPSGSFSYSEKEYGKHTIAEIVPAGGGESLFYSFANGFLLVSSKSIVAEQVLRQLSTPGILKNPYFTEVNRASANKDISIFINHAWINSFLGNILSHSITSSTDEFGATRRNRPAATAEKFRDFARWSGLYLHFNDNRITFTGLSAADDSLNHFLAVFNNQQPVRFRAEDLLPLNTSFFCSYAFSGKNAFFEQLENYFAHSGNYYHREERMKRFDQGFRGNIRNIFQELVKDEVIVAATTIPVNPENKTVYFIVHTESRAAAEEQIKRLLSNYAVRNRMEPGQLFSEYSINSEVRFPVYRFPFPSFPGLWMGSPFAMAEARFVSFYNNAMVFSNSEQGLHEYLRNMSAGNTLSKDNRYQRFKQSSSNRANIYVFVDVNKAYGSRNELFTPEIIRQVEDKEENIRKFGMISWQVQRDKGAFSNSIAIDFLTDAAEDAQTTWQTVIGNNIATKPQLVINHHDPANREIIFQDQQHNLHLVSHSGLVRWTLPLPGPVLSEIHQVDYYKNGRLQYLFNTKEKLYLIDRNGNNVAHFPVTLKSPATNSVNVFDYHNNRDYRYFVAGENNRIYAYDGTGKIVTGWKFDQTESTVTTPVQHFRVDAKDYIVFKDKSKIYIQDRQGETRVPVSEQFTNSKNPLVLNLNGTPKIVATDVGGMVYYLWFDGKVEEKKTARFSENHFFTVDDLDGNDIPDFVFIDGNEVTVMDENGKKLFNQKLDRPIGHQPNIYTFAADLKKVGITDANSNRIYLFNPDGKLHQGFPLYGNSEFTIGKLSDSSTGLNLIVGSEGGKFYNYTLN